MKRGDARRRLLAIALASLAGYVDAIGFLKLGGLFVSFMSGNSTQTAVEIAAGSAVAFTGAGLIGSFLAGVVAGCLVSRIARSARKPAVLLLTAAGLAVAALLDDGFAPTFVAPCVMAFAMGAMNCVFQRNREISFGVTYMTGTLVKLGENITAAMLGEDRFGWVPYLALWSGLVAGSLLGAVVYPSVGGEALWAATGAALVFAGLSTLIGPAPDGAPRPSR